jgi:isochorismate synthase
VLVSIGEPLAGVDPLSAFAAAEPRQRAYWEHQEPDGGARIAIAGIGAASTIRVEGARRFAGAATAWSELLDGALIEHVDNQVHGDPILMGGFSFDPARPRTADWEPFPDGMLLLPRLMLAATDAGCRLTLNYLLTHETVIEQEVSQLARLRDWIARLPAAEPDAADYSTPEGLQLEESIPGARWQGLVAETTREIREGRYAKVVLARQARLHLPATPGAQAAGALRRLRANYPGNFLFAVAMPGHQATTDGSGRESIFLGATPERLLRMKGDIVETTVLAGSARRGATPEEDQRIGSELLANAKDRQEHAVVAMMLRMSLAGYCRGLDAPEAPTLLRLPNVQHLYTPVRGHLDGAHSILELVARLHPTPAVGGFPRQMALRVIRQREGLDRGWYAGPVGWLDRHGQGEFAVAIRSALLRTRQTPTVADEPEGTEALLFAGCGIMGDSDPAREYAESRIKMQAMLAALAG